VNKRNQLVIIGIDGLDGDLLFKFLSEMPNFREIVDRSPHITMKSTYPYDSETAWATIYTGLNPAKTGVLNFKNPFDEQNIQKSITEEEIYGRLKGKTFWDYLGREGKRVCVLFPHACYPAWPVNGIMVCRSMRAEKGFPVTSNPKIFREKELSYLNTMRKIPIKRKMAKTIIASKKLVINEMEFGLKMLKEEKWDFFFLYSSTMDYIEHFFWNYFDENDPTFIGDNPYKSVIKEFYILYDKVIGKFMECIDKNTGLIILSDHGHGMRPIKLLNINEILRRRGFLTSKINCKSQKRNMNSITEKLKELTKKVAINYQFGEFTRRILQHFPSLRKMYLRSSIIDWENSVAHVSDPSGIKHYSYGGIFINRGKITSAQEYEKIRNLIINELKFINDHINGNSIFKWIRKREELEEGEYIALYPDIVFELEDGYGVGWEICKSLISYSKTHLLQPGGHRVDTPVFLLHNLDNKKSQRYEITLVDVAPTILELSLGLQ